MMWRVYSSKTKKTRKIPVRPDVAELTRRLMKTAPKGSGLPLFRNTQGNAWKPATGKGRFLQIKAKLGWDKDPIKRRYSCYSCRHTFAHRMLSGYWNGGVGCSIEILAELIGDTSKVASTTMVVNGASTIRSRCGRRLVQHPKSRSCRAKHDDQYRRLDGSANASHSLAKALVDALPQYQDRRRRGLPDHCKRPEASPRELVGFCQERHFPRLFGALNSKMAISDSS